MKDYKQITFYLCTTEDLSCSESCSHSEDEHVDTPICEGENSKRLDVGAGPSGCSVWVPSTPARIVKKKGKLSAYFLESWPQHVPKVARGAKFLRQNK